MSKTSENILNILLCTNFQRTLMLVDGCILAQFTAWAYRAIFFNCAALQAVHYFLKNKNLLCSWLHLNFFDTYYNVYLTFYLNNLKIYHSTTRRCCTFIGYLYFTR